ncbi:hypothetical protein HanIR_Chr08g0354621 [Helianthus annuus]|nr:hypothetical protein HanIR_Chr08g0354621 [Helianthus annuus]
MEIVPTPSRNGDGRRTVPAPPRPVESVECKTMATKQQWWPLHSNVTVILKKKILIKFSRSEVAITGPGELAAVTSFFRISVHAVG